MAVQKASDEEVWVKDSLSKPLKAALQDWIQASNLVDSDESIH